MGNCLVTKLKGVVDNDNLLKLGEIAIDFDSSRVANITETQRSIRLSFVGTPGKVTASGNAFTVDGTSYTTYEGWGGIFIFPAGKYKINVSKYNLYTINNYDRGSIAFRLNLSDLDYSPLYTYSPCNIDCYGEKTKGLDTVGECNFCGWEPRNIFTGALDVTKLGTNLRVLHSFATNTYGNIELLANRLTLNRIQLVSTKCTGDVYNLIKGLIANGKADGQSIAIQATGLITWKGVPFESGWVVTLPGGGFNVTFTINSTAEDGFTYVRG